MDMLEPQLLQPQSIETPNFSIQQDHQVPDVDDDDKEEIIECSKISSGGTCAICLDSIPLQETALVKGCEHAYWWRKKREWDEKEKDERGLRVRNAVLHDLTADEEEEKSSDNGGEVGDREKRDDIERLKEEGNCFYSVNCILMWATYHQNPSCPQCKHPFQFLHVHRSLDGSIHDYMFEESVCLLLRATWFKPLTVEVQDEVYEEQEHFYQYEEDDEDDGLDDVYFSASSSIRIGNRRWGDNGYVRAGRKEARPITRESFQDSDSGSGSGSSHGPKKKEVKKDTTGRRAKRALKREAADKAAAVKHQNHLLRLGHN
ncbi:hypothetical protein GIB67_034776 [Kingdonia uniflora]|uniref:Uncharacterized protein n=1 Tax=Kingdonia uniflora TaxID=39325 RepID=A0A7J7ME66_9MAGN|nr:hypothetical protein GIB67_034776 [Kingdonia uniflora]